MSVISDRMHFHGAEFLHVKPGKGAAFVRSKLKNYVTGNTVERTFRAGEQVCPEAEARVTMVRRGMDISI